MKTGVAVVFVSLLVFLDNSFAGPLCGLAPSNHNPSADQYPSPLANQQMKAVHNLLCRKFRCPSYSLRINHTISNAMASTNRYGNTIRYNPTFIYEVAKNHGSNAAIGIFAHELGHLIDFFINKGQIPQAQREAIADKYAGCVFALAGYPENSLIGLARSIHSMGASPIYPTPVQRVQLIRMGYRFCRK